MKASDKSLFTTTPVLAAVLLATLVLVACTSNTASIPNLPTTVGTPEARPRTVEALLASEGSTTAPARGETSDATVASALNLPTPTPEPRPLSLDDKAKPPEYSRLDFDNDIVVAFVDDQTRGRIAFVTHVPTGAQAVLNKEVEVIERYGGTGEGDGFLDATLAHVGVLSKIQESFLYEDDLPGNGFMDWVNAINFNGNSYTSKGKRGGGNQVEPSYLGPVLYRVAFHLDANLVPGNYRVRDGDAALLPPGTPIHSVVGYSPSERLAAVVDDQIWLFKRSP